MSLRRSANRARRHVDGAAGRLPDLLQRTPGAACCRCCASSDDDAAVEQAFREILEDRPTSAQVRREVAVQAIQNGDYAEAIRELKKSIAVNPDYPDLHNYLGIAYGNSGMADDAIEEFETALKINPFYLKARLNLALALVRPGTVSGSARTHRARAERSAGQPAREEPARRDQAPSPRGSSPVCRRQEFVDYYQVLRIWPTASEDAIKKAYFNLAKLFHPDVVGRGSREVGDARPASTSSWSTKRTRS